MKIALSKPLLLLGLIVLVGSCGKVSSDTAITADAGPPLFTLLPAEHTGVAFQNKLTEGLNTNILMYEYFYNGGGVATGDFNGDGLIDLYFSSNMSDNQLYLNRGDLRFEDITVPSGAGGRPGPWKTGVTIVDINGDGRLDLYLCYSGMLPDAKRVNQLFVNEGNDANGVPRFRERAAEYGLNSPAFSNQAYFFDADRDGDLDMLLLNHNPRSLPVLNEVSTAQMLQQDDPLQGIRFYRQSDGRFTDETATAGISGSPLTYGLGIGITDVNNDGWPDFYVSNDYTIPDYLYLNDGDGTFTNKLPEQIGHNSHFSMGNDVADVNNDGWTDIVTLDMLPEDNHRQKLLLSPDNYAKFDLNLRSGFHYQYMRNMLQLNNANGTFSEIGQMAGLSNTDWSWSALLADYDNDGWKDLYVTNGYFRDYTNLDFIKYMDQYVKNKGRLVREDVLELIGQMPASDVVNYALINQGGLRFANSTNTWGLAQPANSNGAAYADLDNDGDLDLVVNNINQPAFLYRNEARTQRDHHYLQVELRGAGLNTLGIGTKVTLFSGDQQQVVEQAPSRGYLSSVSPVLHFGLGGASRVDSLLVVWPDGRRQTLTEVAADQRLILSQQEATATAKSPEAVVALFEEVPAPLDHEAVPPNVRDFDRQPLLISELSFQGPCMVSGDVNGDRLEDIFIGATAGQSSALYLQQPAGRFVRKAVSAFETDKSSADADAAIFDANGDGSPDIYVASGGYHDFQSDDPRLQDRLYLNDGRGNFTRGADALPEMLVSKGCVAVQDVNGDGHPDLFVGGRVIPGSYPEPPRSYLLINDGRGRFTDRTAELAPELQQLGMITDAEWVDLDGAGAAELVVVGEWLPVTVFAVEQGKLANRTDHFLDQSYSGWWNTIAVADVNNDRKPDLLIGNQGLNNQFRVSATEPAELYYQDFDNNQAVDPIFSFYIQGRRYPYITRDELLQQLTEMRKRYTSYKSYADVTLDELFTEARLSDAGRWAANHLETTLFLSGTDGKLTTRPLPLPAQYSPVHTITPLDYDEDGHTDVLLCGNNSHAKLRLGRYDANYGVLLRGNGQGEFEYVPQAESGFRLKGDVRGVVKVEDILLFGRTEGGVAAYRRRQMAGKSMAAGKAR